MLTKLIDRLKDDGIMPWEIELVSENEALLEDGYITESEYKLLENCEQLTQTFENCNQLHELLKFAYADLDPTISNLEIPETVKEAYKAAQEDYRPAAICTDLLFGVADYWYDDVLNDYIDSFDKKETGVLALYLYGDN